MMTSMMCSTMTSVMPERWMSRTKSIASCTSRWVSPAIASSSSRIFGSVASARAISSRLRPGGPSVGAGASASPAMPTRSSTPQSLVSASLRFGGPVDDGQDAAGLEARDQQDNRAIDHEGETGALAAEQAVGDFLQRHQDRSPHQRAEQQARAAKRSHDQDLHRDQDAEAGVRIDEAEHHRIKRAGDAGQPRAQHEGVELGAGRRRAERT